MSLCSFVFLCTQIRFQPVPKVADLQALIPSGRSAVAAKRFEPPVLAFGTYSLDGLEDETDRLHINPQKTDDSSPGGAHYY